MADKLEVDVVAEEPPFSGFLPPDEHEWWKKQLGKPVEAPEPEPALH